MTRTMRNRTRALQTVASACVLWLLPAASSAQMLDLDGPKPPAAGSGSVTMGIADRLMKEADELEEATTPDIDPSDLSAPPPEPSYAARVSVELRRLAARIIREGESQGPTGSRIVVLGLTLGDSIGAIENLLDAKDNETLEAFLLADLRQLSRRVPKRVDLIESDLRDALAELLADTDASTRSGWFTDKQPPSIRSAALDSRRLELFDLGLTDAQLEDFDTLIAEWETLERWPTHRRELRRLARLVLEVPTGDQGLPALRNATVRRLGDVMGSPYTARQADRLAALARESQLLERAERFPRDNAGRRDRQRLLLGMADRDPWLDDLDVDRAIELLDLAEELGGLPNERALIVPLRPIFRVLLPTARAAAARGRAAGVELAIRPGATTDPAALAHASALEDTTELFRGLIDLNKAVQGEQAQPRIEFKALCDRIAAIGRDGASGDVEGANDLIRRLLEDRALSTGFDGLLTQVLPYVGDEQRAEKIVLSVGTAQSAWSKAWSLPTSQGMTDTQRRDGLVMLRLLQIISDASAAEQRSLEPWPGWRLTQDAAGSLNDGLRAALDSALTRSFDDGLQARRLADELDDIEESFAAVLLMGRLSRLLPATIPDKTSADRVFEYSLGPALPEAWMYDELDDIALVCRYAGETALDRSDDDLRPFIATKALPLRERLIISE